MSVFTACDLGVVRVTTDCADTGITVIKVANFTAAVPITGYTLELSTNHQFLHSLNEFIYAFAFGDRVGELTLTGIAFTSRACAAASLGDSPAQDITDEVNQTTIYNYYMQNKFSRNLAPTQIQIGESPIALIGFLTGVRMEVPNPALPIMQWSLRYSVIIDAAVAPTTSTTTPAPPNDGGTVGIDVIG